MVTQYFFKHFIQIFYTTIINKLTKKKYIYMYKSILKYTKIIKK